MTAQCSICGADQIMPVIARRDAPAFQNAVYSDRSSAITAARGDLEFRRCQACGFTWNAAFDASRTAYSPSYENRQSLSPAFRAHLETRAAAAMALIGERPAPVIVEVGCGQGDFLAVLAEAAGTGARLFGFDPAWRGDDGDGPAGAEIFCRLFDEHELLAGRPPDLIVSRHVIEHIADPIAFLAGLRRTAGAETRLAIETPDVDWILETGAWHDFFYEHCSLFSLAALDQALRRTGFAPTRLERVFDGQYLWAEAAIAAVEPAPSSAAYLERWEAVLREAKPPVLVWGAGAKGATFVQMFDPDGARIAAVVDVNPAKQGRYLGGGGHQVLAPEAATALAPGAVLVMNPAYEAEIAAQATALGWTARIIVVR